MAPVTPPAAPATRFLSLIDIDPATLSRLLATARQMKADRHLRAHAPTAAALAGLHVALLFEKPSLRTRTTFEVAVRELGAETVHLSSALAEGVREPLEDIARNLERWVHALVLRTFGQEKALKMAAAGQSLSVVNALTDEEHPCQALADVMTLCERWESPRGRTIAYVGDGNNVATSLVHAATMLGIGVRIASPAGYELPDRVIDQARTVARDGAQVERCAAAEDAVRGADAVYTDVWASMGEEHEAAQRKVIFAPYQVNRALMSVATRHALFMHCLPAHRGEEVTAEVLESPASVVFDQAENRLHTQKALLFMLLT